MNWNDVFSLSSAMETSARASGVSAAENQRLRRVLQTLRSERERDAQTIQALRAELDRARKENESLRAQLAGRM